MVDWQCPSFGSSLPISCSSLLFFSEDSNVSVLQEVMLTPADLVTVVAIKRSVFGIRGAGPTPLTALGILFAVLRHSGAEMALCRWLLSPSLCSSLWTADIWGSPGTWQIDSNWWCYYRTAGTRLSLGLGREHCWGCMLFGDRCCYFCLTGWHSALPELFGNPFPFPSPCSQVQVFCRRLSNTGTITVFEHGFHDTRTPCVKL